MLIIVRGLVVAATECDISHPLSLSQTSHFFLVKGYDVVISPH